MKLKSWYPLPLLPLLLIVFGIDSAKATTITAATCSQSDVQNAINSAVSADTVRTPGPCTASWGSKVTIPSSKGITVDGGGNTTLTSNGFNIQQGSTTSRVTGFTFTNGNELAMSTSGSRGSGPFRIDHNTFSAPNTQSIFIDVSGNAPGLIDHNNLTGDRASEMIHNLGMGASDASGWSDDVIPGSANMLFIEDNTFTYNASGNPAYFWGTSAVQAYYGARTVFRHNTLNMCQVDQHGTAGAIGARWWEIYANTFNTTVSNADQCCYIVLRAGGGVVFNNHHNGANQSAGTIELVEEDSGYPALYQIGRGVNQHLSPAYLWGNDSSMIVTAGSSNVQQGRDYFVSSGQPVSMLRQELNSDISSTTYVYAPYIYPHPLQVGIGPQPPGGLNAQVQ